MHNPPKGVDLKFSSFAKKPAFTTLGLKKQTKSKYRPGGEWAEDPQTDTLDLGGGNDRFSMSDTNQNTEPEIKLNNEVDFGIMNTNSESTQKQKKKGSKFSFIKKEKNKKNARSAKKEKKDGLIDAVDLKGEKYAYPRKIVNAIVEPIGARKKPSESVLQNFIKQTANFDPRIILSILYHNLVETNTVWLSKYRGLIALEALMIRNEDYKKGMKPYESLFVKEINKVGEGLEFTQRSHEQLLKKSKQAVLKLIEGDEVKTGGNGFDFGKMNEMMSKMEKEKSNKNGNFLDKMNMIRKKKGKKELQSENTGQSDLLLDLDFGGQTNNQPTANNQKKANVQSDDLFDLDFGGGGVSNNQDSEGFENPLKNDNFPSDLMNDDIGLGMTNDAKAVITGKKEIAVNQGIDLFGLDLVDNSKPAKQTNPAPAPTSSKYDDLDFL